MNMEHKKKWRFFCRIDDFPSQMGDFFVPSLKLQQVFQIFFKDPNKDSRWLPRWFADWDRYYPWEPRWEGGEAAKLYGFWKKF